MLTTRICRNCKKAPAIWTRPRSKYCSEACAHRYPHSKRIEAATAVNKQWKAAHRELVRAINRKSYRKHRAKRLIHQKWRDQLRRTGPLVKVCGFCWKTFTTAGGHGQNKRLYCGWLCKRAAQSRQHGLARRRRAVL